jgi:hypothetical protein
MPNIHIDENALKILKTTQQIMKGRGESTSYSDVIREHSRATVNLCDSCKNVFAECNANPRFGTGKGNDYVFDCDEYQYGDKTI